MKQVSRSTLHWVLAVLIIVALTIGFFVLAAMPNADPQKIGILRIHMAGGMLILALMVIRFIVRMRTLRPAGATTGYPLLDRIAPMTHYGFYVLVLLMVGSGYTTGILADFRRSCSVARVPRCCPLRDLSELCGTRLYCDNPCRLHRFARACRALPSIRYERWTIPANVLRATCPKSLDADGMIAPINDAALQAGDVSAIRLCHVAFGSFATEPSGLQRIPMSAMVPTATKELQRRDWSRWAKSDCTHCSISLGLSEGRRLHSSRPH